MRTPDHVETAEAYSTKVRSVTRISLLTARVSDLTPKISHPKQVHNPSALGLLFYN